jgi:hypothetical protein
VTFFDIMRAVITDPNIQVGAGYIEGLRMVVDSKSRRGRFNSGNRWC